jgi:hypothetical protein
LAIDIDLALVLEDQKQDTQAETSEAELLIDYDND